MLQNHLHQNFLAWPNPDIQKIVRQWRSLLIDLSILNGGWKDNNILSFWQSTFSMQNARACSSHMAFQIVCYDWINLYFCKQRRENLDRKLWEKTETT